MIDKEAEELKTLHDHADPAVGGKTTDGGGKANVDDDETEKSYEK